MKAFRQLLLVTFPPPDQVSAKRKLGLAVKSRCIDLATSSFVGSRIFGQLGPRGSREEKKVRESRKCSSIDQPRRRLLPPPNLKRGEGEKDLPSDEEEGEDLLPRGGVRGGPARFLPRSTSLSIPSLCSSNSCSTVAILVESSTSFTFFLSWVSLMILRWR